MQGEQLQPQTPFLVAAVVLFVVALVVVFGNEHYHVGPNSITSNLVVGLTALGFALAGGLSLVAAAIATRREELREDTQRSMLSRTGSMEK